VTARSIQLQVQTTLNSAYKKLELHNTKTFPVLQALILTVEAEVVVCEDSWLRTVALHRHQNAPSSCFHALLDNTRIIPGQRPRVRKLELDVLELYIIHTVRRHCTADKTHKISKRNHPYSQKLLCEEAPKYEHCARNALLST